MAVLYIYTSLKMNCEVLQQNKHICGRLTFRNELYCYIHLRKWIQLELRSLGKDIKFPRKLEEIENGLSLIKEINPNYVDKLGFNIIHEEVISSNIALINRGIKIGVNINGRSFANLYTPLHFARCHVPDIIPLLLKAGANKNAKNIFRFTFLDKEKNNIKFYKI